MRVAAPRWQSCQIDNPNFRGLGPGQIRWAVTTFHHGVYQPLGWLIFEAESATWGLDPRGYHRVSLPLHPGCSVVLYALVVTVLRACRPGLDGARPWALHLGVGLLVMMFAVHPLRAEVVDWAACQPCLPCVLFSMPSVLAYLRCRSGRSFRAVGKFDEAITQFPEAFRIRSDDEPARRGLAAAIKAKNRGGISPWGGRDL